MNRYIAKTFAGMESVLAEELISLGAQEVKTIVRGVSFQGSTALMYKINYQSRLALRILLIIKTFSFRNEKDLYNNISKIAWENHMEATDSLAIDAVSFHQKIKHSLYISQLAKDAIADRFRNKEGQRPSIDLTSPDIRVHVHIDQQQATIALDSSGVPLFKRGYRLGTIEAPINEVLAAGLLAFTGWNGEQPLYDPMCGSGTFLIEAVMKITNTPAGKYRKDFGFMNWKDFNQTLWNEIKHKADEKIIPFQGSVTGSDISRKSLSMARRNLQEAGFADNITLEIQDFFKREENFSGTIITNPPYDERLNLKDVESFYKDIGKTLKHTCINSNAWIITGNMEAINVIGLRPSQKIKVFNGKLECRFLEYKLYSGSKKQKYNREEP